MKVQRIVWNVFILGILAVFVLAMVPEKAWAPPFTVGESSKPSAKSPASQPTTRLPISQPPAIQPPAGHTGPRLPASSGPAPGAVLPHFKPGGGATGQLPPPGQAKGFDVFTPSESGKMLPGAAKGHVDNYGTITAPTPEGPVSWDPGEKPAEFMPGAVETEAGMALPGSEKFDVGEEDEAAQQMPQPGESKGVILGGGPGPGPTEAPLAGK